jgi:hypothetical protein
VTPATPSIALGLPQQFVATGTYTDATTQDITTTVTWGSDTPATATISNAGGSKGLATTVATGTSEISATLGLVSGSTTLTVTPVELVSINVTPAASTVDHTSSTTQQMTAAGTYTDGSVVDLTTVVTWSSSDTNTVDISNAGGTEGLATYQANGTVTITATNPGGTPTGSTTLTFN